MELSEVLTAMRVAGVFGFASAVTVFLSVYVKDRFWKAAWAGSAALSFMTFILRLGSIFLARAEQTLKNLPH